MDNIEKKKEIINTILKIKEARIEVQKALFEENRYCQPQLTDLSKIPELYQDFIKIVETKKCSDSDKKRFFIFIIVYLYAPKRLFGGRMTTGLRRAIGKALNMHAHSTVSDYCTSLLIMYLQYKDFQDTINDILVELLKGIKDKGESI